MRENKGIGIGAIVGFVCAFVFCVAAGVYWYLVNSGQIEGWKAWLRIGDPEIVHVVIPSPEEASELEPKAFPDYSFDELNQISELLVSAGDDLEAYARYFNLTDDDGHLVTDPLLFRLSDGTVVEARLADLCHDVRADTGERAGITLMCSTLSLAKMNDANTTAGGWEASDLRDALATTGFAALPEDLQAVIKPVYKSTNNVGETNSVDSVSYTQDYLWPFSAVEVCGDIDWFWREFTDNMGNGGYEHLDELLNKEGSQYRVFSEADVSADGSNNASIMQVNYRGTPCAWWLRSPYPLSYMPETTYVHCFYQVMASGYPNATGQANTDAGVVVGICI